MAATTVAATTTTTTVSSRKRRLAGASTSTTTSSSTTHSVDYSLGIIHKDAPAGTLTDSQLALLGEAEKPLPPTATTRDKMSHHVVMDDLNFKPMLRHCLTKLVDQPGACNGVADWDISRVTDCSWLLWEPRDPHDQDKNGDQEFVMVPGAEHFKVDVSRWNTSSCTSMRSMFQGAASFNAPIGSFDTSKVTDMAHMFHGATHFDHDLGTWNVEKVTDMSFMFEAALNYNNGNNHYFHTSAEGKPSPPLVKTDLNAWNVSKVETFQGMFWYAHAFNTPIGDWDVSRAHDELVPFSFAFVSTFDAAHTFNQNLSKWQIGPNVHHLNYMFQDAMAFNQDLSAWPVHQVTDFTNMFQNASAMQQTLCWDVDEEAATTTAMFSGTKNTILNPNPQKCLLKQKIQRNKEETSMVGIVVLLSMMCLFTIIYKWIRRRYRKRLVIFRAFGGGQEEGEGEILFGDGKTEIMDDSENVDESEEYFHDEEGEISFEEKSPSASPKRPSPLQQQQALGGPLFSSPEEIQRRLLSWEEEEQHPSPPHETELIELGNDGEDENIFMTTDLTNARTGTLFPPKYYDGDNKDEEEGISFSF